MLQPVTKARVKHTVYLFCRHVAGVSVAGQLNHSNLQLPVTQQDGGVGIDAMLLQFMTLD